MITSYDDLLQEAQALQDFLESEIPEDINIVVERGNQLSSYLARSGKMTADAKYWMNIHQKQSAERVIELIREDLISSATSRNSLVEAYSADQRYLYNWTERLNRACTHQLDWCRTLVSKAKAELQAGI